jgi:hypothetical protein
MIINLLPGLVPPDLQKAAKRREQAFAKDWQEHVNTVRRIPVEATDDAMKRANEADPIRAIHNLDLYDLEGAFNYESEKLDIFRLRAFDTEIEHVLDTALQYVIQEVQYEQATVCGIAVGLTLTIIENFRPLAKYANRSFRPDPRSVAEIRAEMADEFPRAVRRLQQELDLALKLEKEAAAGDDNTSGASK